MMRINIEFDRICEDGSIENCSRIGYYEMASLETYEQVYEWCRTMIMAYVDSDYCDMRIYLWGELFMAVDLSSLRWAVNG